jgi:hypothetical protein
MASIDATASGSFKVGDDITIRRLGFGAMRITGCRCLAATPGPRRGDPNPEKAARARG